MHLGSKYVYKISYLHYIKKLLFYGISSALSFMTSFLVLKNLGRIMEYGIVGFGLKAILVANFSILSTTSLLCTTREMNFLIGKIARNKPSVVKIKLIVVCSTVIMIALSIIFGGGE